MIMTLTLELDGWQNDIATSDGLQISKMDIEIALSHKWLTKRNKLTRV